MNREFDQKFEAIPTAAIARDTDGNGTISPTEFRLGLASLGFDVANVSQLRALQQQMDVDHTI